VTIDEEIALGSAALAAVEQIVKTVKDAKSGAITPAAALAALQSFDASIAANNAAADSALDAKFPAG